MEINIESKNVEKQQQQLAIVEDDEDEMSVPNWLVDVLKWISRIEMANSSLSFSCKLFKQLCWPKLHEDVKAHIVPFLMFYYDLDKSGNIRGILNNIRGQTIPIAAISPPEYIHGFQKIIIRFLDTQIIEFFKIITLEEITLSLNWQENDTRICNLLTILANNIYELQISNYKDVNHFSNFNRLFPAFIDQIPFLVVNPIVDLDLDILFNWLMKPLTDGRQKILRYSINFHKMAELSRQMELRFINRIKKEFLQSTKKRNFLIQLEFVDEYAQFSMENEQTGEVLNLYEEISSVGYSNNFLGRYPKGEEHWKERSEEKIYRNGNTHIRLNIDEIMKKKNCDYMTSRESTTAFHFISFFILF